MLNDFRMRINDQTFNVRTPHEFRRQAAALTSVTRAEAPATVKDERDEASSTAMLASSDRLGNVDDLRAKIAALYSIFEVDEFKLRRERALVGRLELVEQQLRPLEIVRRRQQFSELKSFVDAKIDRQRMRTLFTQNSLWRLHRSGNTNGNFRQVSGCSAANDRNLRSLALLAKMFSPRDFCATKRLSNHRKE